jgi:2-polyprenyl-6-methoxyphenol hydroxylase-like FAD-dependent oxidoreductase
MPTQLPRVLISGASVAGPTAPFWLCRQGFAVTVAERMPLARVCTSGHAVDLFGPAVDVAEWAGVLPAVMDARTRTDIVSFQRSLIHSGCAGTRQGCWCCAGSRPVIAVDACPIEGQ